jgi:hypothetical protein
MKSTAIDELLDQVGELCRIYCGNGPSEQWIETCRRLEEMNRTLKRARRERQRQLTKEGQ